VEDIESKMRDLRRQLGGRPAAAAHAPAPTAVGRPKGRRHRMSAEGRARIAAAQRARWAKFKKTKAA